MVTATLRKPAGAAPPVVDVEATAVKSTTTVAGKDLTEIIPAEQVADEAENPSKPQLPAPRTSSAIAARSTSYASAGIDGDWNQEDLKFPQLVIVQGSGERSKNFDNGTIIYNDMELLPTPSMKEGAKNTPIRFIPVSITKQFREKLNAESVAAGEIPRIFNSVTEVEEAGLTTRWIGRERPDNYAEPSARLMLLIEQPEGSDHPGFVVPLNGKNYAVAVYYAAGGAFRDSAKIIFNTALTSLMVPILDNAGQPRKGDRSQILKKPMLHKCFWTLSFVKKEVGGFMVWRPVVKLLSKEESGDEIRAYVTNLLSGSPEALAADAE